MNLLNSIFNIDDLEIKKTNKKHFIIFVFLMIVLIMLLLVEKNKYYVNSFTIIDKKIALLVENDRIDDVKENNKIIINNIMCNYSIKKIESVDNSFIVYIKIDVIIDNLSSGKYMINLGKERLFEYVIRIIKN